MLHSSIARFVVPSLLCAVACGQEYQPKIRQSSEEGEKAISKFAYPKDLKVTLWASEPALANPVAFCHDVHGRVYVAETFRLHKGVTDNRSHSNWLDEELACRTVDDRVAMYKRKFANKIDDWQSEHERIRLLEDTNGDGKADRSVVYADGFKELPDGIAAGLLAHEGKVWFTCIPKLWILEDKDGDGRADEREAVQDGYGVHTSLLGHDMHGLRIGPDGKLYFSIGDRGFHVVTPQRTLSFPDEGAVLRCNLDGSDLEVVHRGLRNPQELAFDNFGNLFTGDNNSDGGDKARWVYIVEGGNSGWHIGYQSIGGRGPWNKEKLWHPHWRGQAAYIVPPITNIANGPSGLTFDPGVGLPARYRNKFFLCEFRGGSGNSGILSIGLSPKGASFELTDEEQFLWKVLPTDVDFGFDGAMYIADWTEGWGQPLKGRMYRVAVPGIEKDPLVVETARLMKEGLSKTLTDKLVELLNHRDQRLRQAAQFELARRTRTNWALGDGSRAVLTDVATTDSPRMARIHAIWAIGQLGQTHPELPGKLLGLLDDPDHEIRAQVAKVMGQAKFKDALRPLIARLEDRSSRVRFFAAISLGQLGDVSARTALVKMLRENADRDPYLRHAGVMGLSGNSDLAGLQKYAGDPSFAVRLAMVLVHRRHETAEIARFLNDADPLVVLEAARAIHDVPIVDAMPNLAAILGRAGLKDPQLLTRAVNANYRVGTEDCIERLKDCITSNAMPQATRVDAVKTFVDWAKPSGRDRVINLWRPLEPRDAAPVLAQIRPELASLLGSAPDQVCKELLRLIDTYRVGSDLGDDLVKFVEDRQRSGALRSSALEMLDRLGHPEATRCAQAAAVDKATDLRKVGVRILSRLNPTAAVPVLENLIATASMTERQNAMSTLGKLDSKAADAALVAWLDKLSGDTVEKSLRLELLEAAALRKSPTVSAKLKAVQAHRMQLASKDILKSYDECLEGGDKNRGQKLFWRDDAAISCQRCHRIKKRGGEAGPDLASLGHRLSREEILISLLDPGRSIAEGFATIVFSMRDDSLVAGVVTKETAKVIHVIDAAGKEIKLDPSQVVERTKAGSSMPPLQGILKKSELRDLVEFLAAQKAGKKPSKPGKAAPGHGK
jgi:quinoprotein glucose dehydrogenase